MGRTLDRLKALASFPLAMYAGGETALHPDTVGEKMAEAVMEIPKIAETIGEFEAKAIDALRHHDPPAAAHPAPERHGLIPDSPEVESPEHPELEF